MVQKSGFSRIRRPDDGNFEPVPYALGHRYALDLRSKRCRDLVKQTRNLRGHIDRNIFVGKIDGRFQKRGRPNQSLAPSVNLGPEGARQDPQGLAPLSLGFRLEQVAQSFDLREVENAVFQCASREFAGFGQPQTVDAPQGREQRRHGCRTAMALKFNDIFPGKTGTFGKAQYQSLIERHAIGIREPTQTRLPRRRQRPRQRERG